MSASERGNHLSKKIGVFKIAQQTKVDKKAESYKPLTPYPILGLFHPLGNEEVADCNNGQQEEIGAAALVVKIVGEEQYEQ